MEKQFRYRLGSGGGAAGTLSPAVPEPSALFLFSVGLVAVFATHRTRPNRRLEMLHAPVCTSLVIATTLVVLSRPALAAAPNIQLTKIGNPIWKPVDFQLFSAPATPFDAEFGQVYNTLLPYDTPPPLTSRTRRPTTPSSPPA